MVKVFKHVILRITQYFRNEHKPGYESQAGKNHIHIQINCICRQEMNVSILFNLARKLPKHIFKNLKRIIGMDDELVQFRGTEPIATAFIHQAIRYILYIQAIYLHKVEPGIREIWY